VRVTSFGTILVRMITRMRTTILGLRFTTLFTTTFVAGGPAPVLVVCPGGVVTV
jgi:hypothetical protein